MKRIKLAFDKEGKHIITGDTIFDDFDDYKVLEVLKKNCVRVKLLGYVENKEKIINTKKCILEEKENHIATNQEILMDRMSDVTFNGQMLCM